MKIHKKWQEINGEFVPNIVKYFGGKIRDKRNNKCYDPGQAICAETYGPDWMNNPEFWKIDGLSIEDAPEDKFYESAKKMANGYIPEWVLIQT